MKKFKIVVLFAAIAAAPATAQLTWFADRASFEAANSANILAGIEDYEASILPPNSVDGFNDPLQFGVPNQPDGFPFPNGTQGLMNLTTQANTLGANPTVPSRQGVNALAAGSIGFAGFTSDQVVVSTFVNSIDLIFAGGNVAVGGNVIDLLGSQTGVNIRVYDTANNFLGESLVPGNAAGTSFTGVISGGAAIGRVNLFSPGAEGMDNVQAYNVPEPASLSLFLLGGLALLRRRP